MNTPLITIRHDELEPDGTITLLADETGERFFLIINTPYTYERMVYKSQTDAEFDYDCELQA